MNFIDTGAFLALHHRSDQYHRDARQQWLKLRKPVTSNLVVVEFTTAVSRILGYQFAADCAGDIYAAQQIQVLASTRSDEVEALNWMRKYADQRVSFTDCVSFAMMRRNKIGTAFTYDRHFVLAGFRTVGLK